MATVTAIYITYQCLEQDYCIVPSIRSVLPVVDKVLINDGGSTDGTKNAIVNIGSPKVHITTRKWKHDKGFWARERNFLIEQVDTDWILLVDGDEALHEEDYPKIRRAIASDNKAFAFKIIHFFGNPNTVADGRPWYTKHCRLWRKNTGIRLGKNGNCADDILFPNGRSAHYWGAADSGCRIFYYGWARSPVAQGRKLRRVRAIYHGSNEFEDGKLPPPAKYVYPPGGKPFTGTHPKVMSSWVKAHGGTHVQGE